MSKDRFESRREHGAAEDDGTAGQSLQPERAFVVQLRGPASRSRMQGRVEHVVSGEAVRFGSTAELLDFLAAHTLPRMRTP